MEQVAEDALIVAIRCFSHADLGMVKGGLESSEVFSLRTDDRMQAAVRADSQHGEDMSPVGGLDYLSRHIDSKVGEEPYASLPVPALLAVEKPASRLLLLAAPGLDELARGFAGLLTSAYGESLTVEVESPDFGLINFKTATQKWLEQLRTEGDSRAELVVRIPVGPGAAELVLATVLGALSVADDVEIVDLQKDKRINHAVVPRPDAWKTRLRLDTQTEISTGDIDQMFFDAVARRSIHAVVMGRAWLEARLLKDFKRELDEGQNGKPSLGLTITLAQNRKKKSKDKDVDVFLCEYAFLNVQAFKGSGNGHRTQMLSYRFRRHLSKSEPVLTQGKMSASPSGKVVVVRCVGLRETPDDGTNWPFVDAVREARDGLLDSALSLDENEREYCTKNDLKFTLLHVLVCSSKTFASAEGARQHIESDASLVVEVKDPDASLVVKVEDPDDTEDCREKVLEALRRMSDWHDCDAVVFLSAPGTQQMQVGAMLGGAQFAIDHGAPIRVGALTRDKNGNGTTLLAPQDVPLLPGLDQELLPVAYGLVMRLELPAAVVILGLLGPRREDLKKAVEALWQGLATWQKPPDAGAAKEALCLIRTALLPDPPETVPEESRALAIALAYLVTEPFKNDKNFKKSQKIAFWVLAGARNSLPTTHGKGSIPAAKNARELLANAEQALANAERAMGLNAGADSLAGRWRACVENWPAYPGDSRESAT